MSSSDQQTISRLLSFWFDHDEGTKKWFMGGEQFDNQCRAGFAGEVQQARNGELESWRATPDGALALLILLDQIPRNIFRGSGESFSSDAKAREVATEAISNGFDRQVDIQRQMFFYLPFMHGETLLSQVASLGMYQGLAARAQGTEHEESTAASVDFSQKHMDAIKRFGRFPARNKALDRKSTPDEEQFLKENPMGL